MRIFSDRWFALNSSIGRRTLSVFLIAALVPSISITLLANYTNDKNNDEHLLVRLQNDSHSLGLALLSQLRTSNELLTLAITDSFDPETMTIDGGNLAPIFDKLDFRYLESQTKNDLSKILIDDSKVSDEKYISIAVPIDKDLQTENLFLVGRLDSEFIWNMAELVGNNNSCIFLRDGTRLFCANNNMPPIESKSLDINTSRTGIFEWKTNADTWQTAYWELFLTGQFDAQTWIITQTIADSPNEFWSMFSRGDYIQILLILVLLPLLAATIHIRKTMQPIDGLMAGVKRIARHDHSQQIAESGPLEFARLARSINTMSSNISSQIKTLHSFSEIDRILLSKKDLGSVCQLLIQLLVGNKELSQAMVVLLDTPTSCKANVYKNIPGTMSIENIKCNLTEPDIANLKKMEHSDSIQADLLPDEIRLLLETDRNTAAYPVHVNNLMRAFIVISADDNKISSIFTELLEGSLERLALALETIERHRKLEFQASRDELPQLANKRLLAKRVDQALVNSTNGDFAGTLLYIDLDFFKSINDIAGHIAGDRALNLIGQRIKRTFSSSTTVARIGGDEFAVFLPQMANKTRVAEAADEIIHALRQPINLAGIEHQLGASIGIARLPEDGKDLEELLFKADLAMYEAKKAGRNTWRYYQPKMKETVQARVSFETELRKAVENEEFTLYV